MTTLYKSDKSYRFILLLLVLVYRDIIARYRRSLLGPLWALLQPLVLMCLFTLMRGIISIPSDGVPYILFSYCALVPWTFFTNALSFCGPSIALNAAIIKKIALPCEVFPLAAVITAFFDFMMASIVLTGLIIWYQIPVGWSLLWVPVLIMLTASLAFGVGMLIAAMGTMRRDFIFATPFLVQFWLYATPIIYPLSAVPERWRTVYMFNPMVGIIEGFRAVLLHNSEPALDALKWSVGVVLLVIAVTWPLFRWFARYFADMV